MADRMDLEARLRALRESKRVPSKPPAPQSAPSSTLPAVDSFSWPEAPSSSVKQIVPVRQPVPVSAEGYDQPARRYSSVFSAQPPVTIMSRCSPAESRAPTSFAASVASSKLTTAKEDMVQPTTAQLLGPDYEKAVQMAQHAIDSERRQMPRTAIDAYIQAGQMLIEIGRRQAAPHLQDIVKSKALALLQRAERLSEWINEVLANDSSQHALAAAYRQSQQNCNKSLTEKQELVLKMQQDNRNMKKKLNQLALLTKVRGRMMKVVRARRARKVAEARETEAQTQAIQDILSSRGVNDVTGEISGYQFEDEESNDVAGFSSDENEESRKIHLHAQSRHTLTRGASSGEVQNVGLINELHERIGIPRIDSFRKFEPLTNDPNTDKRQELLQSELEAAKQEADKLRAAVQEMEQRLQLAAQHSKKHSTKLEQQKAREFAKVQSELDRVREELELERQRSTSLHSSLSSWKSSSAVSDSDNDEGKDARAIDHLRSSLHKALRGCDEQPASVDNATDRRMSIQRNSYSYNSPRYTLKSKEKNPVAQSCNMDEEEVEDDEDGGVWL